MCGLPDYFRLSETTDGAGRTHTVVEFGFGNTPLERQQQCSIKRSRAAHQQPVFQPPSDPIAALMNPTALIKIAQVLMEGH